MMSVKKDCDKALMDFIESDGLWQLLKYACRFTRERLSKDKTSPLPPLASELVNEAIARYLDGTRKWPSDRVDFIGFMKGIVRGLAGHEKHRDGKTESLEDEKYTNKPPATPSNIDGMSDTQLRDAMYIMISGYTPGEGWSERIRQAGPLSDLLNHYAADLTADDAWTLLEKLSIYFHKESCLPVRTDKEETGNADTAFESLLPFIDRLSKSERSIMARQIKELGRSHQWDYLVKIKLENPMAKPRELAKKSGLPVRYFHRANDRFKRSLAALNDTLKTNLTIEVETPSTCLAALSWEQEVSPRDLITSSLWLNKEDHQPRELEKIHIGWVESSHYEARLRIEGSRITPDWPRTHGYQTESQGEARLAMLFRPPGTYHEEYSLAYIRDWALCLDAVANTNPNDNELFWWVIRSTLLDQSANTQEN